MLKIVSQILIMGELVGTVVRALTQGHPHADASRDPINSSAWFWRKEGKKHVWRHLAGRLEDEKRPNGFCLRKRKVANTD